ncbi:hypothetical protein G7046_g1220 [Stylonectria norvegica]|nr:hypothetical protein G7046_g1220 [Stylonectria norvegica]
MYLTALFTDFASLTDASALRQDHQAGTDHEGKFEIQLVRVQVEYLNDHSSESHLREFQGPRGATIVSANKVLGFGQSATQEEIFAGIALEACPAVLVALCLNDETILLVSFARPTLDVTG